MSRANWWRRWIQIDTKWRDKCETINSHFFLFFFFISLMSKLFFIFSLPALFFCFSPTTISDSDLVAHNKNKVEHPRTTTTKQKVGKIKRIGYKCIMKINCPLHDFIRIHLYFVTWLLYQSLNLGFHSIYTIYNFVVKIGTEDIWSTKRNINSNPNAWIQL